ncbi:MAG: hypothetical protein P1P77_10440 [Spirochaetaceae bacterium]|nr:hypothetical protein [Spirochaetaceae bacterium]
MAGFDDSVRFTWYLSGELNRSKSLKAADQFMSAAVDEARDMPGSELVFSAVVREPLPGERRPPSVLPIPAGDGRGRIIPLWSSLVLDYCETRIVIPDVWDVDWFQVDLARALLDLHKGSSFAVGYFDGAGNTRPDAIPAELPDGRWRMDEWTPGVESPFSFDVLMIRDGQNWDEAAVIRELESYVEGGGGILFAPSTIAGPSSKVGFWAEKQSEKSLPRDGGGTVLYLDDPEFLGTTAYEQGHLTLRDLDTALLIAAGRTDLVALASNVSRTPRTTSSGFGRVGSRLMRRSDEISAVRRGGARRDFIEAEAITMTRDDAGEGDSFRLERRTDGWVVASGDWILPARGDRVEAFLRRMDEASRTRWRVSETAAFLSEPNVTNFLMDHTGPAGNERIRFLGTRQQGGGAYVRMEDGVELWPNLGGVELSGDARHWMERRLFHNAEGVIRVELFTDDTLYWRIHERDGSWILTDRTGNETRLNKEAASGYISRLIRIESLTLAPTPESENSSLVLMLEDNRGRRFEYRLRDSPTGRVAAASTDGFDHLLDEAAVSLILNGP